MLAPRDERAGGTWLGINARGLCVAITNGRGPAAEPGWPSRGRLVDELLSASSADQAAGRLEDRLASEAWAPFNLLVADRGRAFVHHHGTLDERIELAAGAHVLTNRHDLNPSVLDPARRQIERAAKQGAAALEAEIFTLLRDHRSWDETDYAICKHGEHYGTLSSVFLTLEARPRFAFCGAPPCQGRFEPYPIEPPEHGS